MFPVRTGTFVSGFKEFLLKNQVLALAIGVIMGAAVGKVVSSLVADILMPVISLAIPGGDWRTSKIVLSRVVGPDGKEAVNAIQIGNFAGNILDFLIIALCVYLLTKALLRPTEPPPVPPSKECPRCLEAIPLAATKCKFCTADL